MLVGNFIFGLMIDYVPSYQGIWDANTIFSALFSTNGTEVESADVFQAN
jgi:hypothetical protein